MLVSFILLRGHLCLTLPSEAVFDLRRRRSVDDDGPGTALSISGGATSVPLLELHLSSYPS